MRTTFHRRPTCGGIWRRAPACLVLAVLAVPSLVRAEGTPQHRPGRVLIIRGAFTVFSLGLDTLGDELEAQGIDVKVVPAFQATSSTQELAELHHRRPEPIVIIGHSKGGLLAPQCAEQLAKSHVPVALVVVVDNPHATTVPANVRRCVNFYQTNWLGVVQGALLKAASPHTEMLNVNIDKLPQRGEGGYIDHFNIDASPWVHKMIVQQVLAACPAPDGTAEAPSTVSGAHRLVTPTRPSGPPAVTAHRVMRPPTNVPPPVPSAAVPRHNPLSQRDIQVMR